jgi:HEAT repeat protein
MSMRHACLAVLLVACAHAPTATAPDEIDAAIAQMKGVDPDRLSKPQRDQKDKDLDAAWKTLLARKEAAIPRLLAALAADQRAARPDHYFRMDASALLWDMQQLDAAPAIARALDGVDLGFHMDVGFNLFTQAAATRDRRAWPVLKHALRLDEKSGYTTFPRHAMEVHWPLILEFIFSPYGPEVCAAAAESAGDPDPRVLRSVLSVLVSHRCLEALPLARKLAASTEIPVARGGIISLGKLAHRDDRALLVQLTKHANADVRQAAAYALYEYGDPQTAPVLRPLLADADTDVRQEAIAGVCHLIDREGAQAVLALRQRAAADSPERTAIDKLFGALASETGADLERLKSGERATWAQAIDKYWAQRDALFELRPGDHKLSRADLMRALAGWEKAGRITGGEFEWVEERHVLSVALPSDLPALLSVRGRILMRHSDEALEELEHWDRVISVLHRRRMGAPKPNE